MSINFYRIMKGILWYLVKPKDEETHFESDLGNRRGKE